MKDSTMTAYACARKDERRRILQAADAVLELQQEDGGHRRLDLLDISASGLSFGLENDRLSVERGTTFDHVVVRVRDIEIRGSMTVAHVTRGFSSGAVCGVEFFPATEFDNRRLQFLLESLSRKSSEPESD